MSALFLFSYENNVELFRLSELDPLAWMSYTFLEGRGSVSCLSLGPLGLLGPVEKRGSAHVKMNKQMHSMAMPGCQGGREGA